MAKKIKVIHALDSNWYKVGEVYTILDEKRYEGIGVQVLKDGNGHVPDVIKDGDFEYI